MVYFKLVLAFLVTLQLTSAEVGVKSRIVGGQPASMSDFPFIVRLTVPGRHHCGGSILDNRTILTAAHCLENMIPQQISVIYGGELEDGPGNFESAKVSKLILHPRYNSKPNYDFDVGIIKLMDTIKFVPSRVQPVQLALTYEKIEANTMAVIAGWGYLTAMMECYPGMCPAEPTKCKPPSCYLSVTDALRLMTTSIPVTGEASCDANGQCQSIVSQVKGKSVCGGDSGGPLIINGRQYGVVSTTQVIPISNSLVDLCPGGQKFARISSHADWIQSQMG